MAISATLKAEIFAAITARAKASVINLKEPLITEEIWADLDNAPDAVRAAFLESGRQALSSGYFEHTRKQPAFFEYNGYEAIKQTIFTHDIFNTLIPREAALDELPAVTTQLFLFFAAALADSLTPAEFAQWFATVFGSMIGEGERVLLKALGTEGEETVGRAPKKAKVEVESKFNKSYTIFKSVRGMQADGRARRDEVHQEEMAAAPEVASSSSSRGIQRLVSRASKHVQRAVGALARVTPTFPTVPAFAPRLYPQPRTMPGA
ncbi:hypothetical protein B0H17DRAFT_8704 [Mycena rosella]|uniref:Uncharacterized protein n=1 Tax=Mycena rosella TaxID=1033263 RepID=A0AAD7M789_MYCRO|nr:hypothetical protein B0H17DRAFT_8704 [Mycena rosella]